MVDVGNLRGGGRGGWGFFFVNILRILHFYEKKGSFIDYLGGFDTLCNKISEK